VRFSVHHESTYRYSTPVTFAPHVLRLHPRPDASRLREQSIVVEPTPLSRVERADPFGNVVSEVTFPGVSASVLRIASTLDVETLPSHGLAHARSLFLPALPWTAPSWDNLGAYRVVDPSPAVHAFAEGIRCSQNGQPIAFLEALTRAIFERTDRGIRTDGAAQPPEVTLEQRRGACRDVALLFLACCRSQGMAARFVSGYQTQAQTPDGRSYLHAWAEVYLEGAGFCGWDAMHGIAAGEGHLALCAAPDQASTMPVEGGFFFAGSDVLSTLDWSLRIATT
jgi:transglutaminase-like putative cysteine protease